MPCTDCGGSHAHRSADIGSRRRTTDAAKSHAEDLTHPGPGGTLRRSGEVGLGSPLRPSGNLVVRGPRPTDAFVGAYVNGAFRPVDAGHAKGRAASDAALRRPPSHVDVAAGTSIEDCLTTLQRLIMEPPSLTDATLLDGEGGGLSSDHTCLAQWKFNWLVRTKRVTPDNWWIASLLSAALGRDEVRKDGGVVHRTFNQQLKTLKAIQEVLFGIHVDIWGGRGVGRDRDGRPNKLGVLRFLANPLGLPHDICPCCDLQAILNRGDTILFAMKAFPANPDGNQPLELTVVRCPPCDVCLVEGKNHRGVRMEFSLNTDTGELFDTVGGELLQTVEGVVVERR